MDQWSAMRLCDLTNRRAMTSEVFAGHVRDFPPWPPAEGERPGGKVLEGKSLEKESSSEKEEEEKKSFNNFF